MENPDTDRVLSCVLLESLERGKRGPITAYLRVVSPLPDEQYRTALYQDIDPDDAQFHSEPMISTPQPIDEAAKRYGLT